MEWSIYWKELLEKNRLIEKVQEMNDIDIEMNGTPRIEDICHKVYDDYKNYQLKLDDIRVSLMKKVESYPSVQMQTSRIKEADSLLLKIIEKRSKNFFSKDNLYAGISGDNYKNIITDLIGIRLIIDYRGSWVELHKKIIEDFPYVDDISLYKDGHFISHPIDGSSILAEIPTAYHALDDDLSNYNNYNVDTELKDNGYRSVHYVVSYSGVYVEIQTRTIFDEAWNDCDHSYVYKKDAHPSHSALEEMSYILSLLTNVSNDLGDRMRYVYEEKLLTEQNGMYIVEKGKRMEFSDIINRIEDAKKLISIFENKLIIM